VAQRMDTDVHAELADHLGLLFAWSRLQFSATS
jgi:hypothetical protein